LKAYFLNLGRLNAKASRMPGFQRRWHRLTPVALLDLRRADSWRGNAKNRGV